MNFNTASELLQLALEEKLSVAEIMLRRETERSDCSREEVLDKLRAALRVMERSAKEALTAPRKTMGGLIGGEAIRLMKLSDAGKNLCGETVSRAVCYAMGVLEVSASMGLIVAAPTAGASGVLPGVLLALREKYELSEDLMLEGLLTASAVGCLTAQNACIAGAAGGCQAEVGTASAMAAAAAVHVMGGSDEAAFSAAATAFQNLLGLVCDPVAGLVEVPCQSRNAVGAANALVSAELALAGVMSVIPFDEVVDAVKRVGGALPESLRETAKGGVAATPTGKRLAAELGAGGCGECGRCCGNS